MYRNLLDGLPENLDDLDRPEEADKSDEAVVRFLHSQIRRGESMLAAEITRRAEAVGYTAQDIDHARKAAGITAYCPPIGASYWTRR